MDPSGRGPALVLVSSAGVFAAAAWWCWLYRRCGSLWPVWVSHVVVDLAVFLIGWDLVFGF